MISETVVADLVRERGCFSAAENDALFNRRFKGGPPRRLRTAIARYGLDRKRVLDVGCSYGEYLLYFGQGSVGLDLQERCVQFARGLGLEARQCEVDADPLPVPKDAFDAVWCSNLLEHVMSPHRFLLKLREHLNDSGLLIIVVPTFIENTAIRHAVRLLLPRHYAGIFAADHINGFTRQTLPFSIERAGFRVMETTILASDNAAYDRTVNLLLRKSWLTLCCAAAKDPDWEYPEKAHKRLEQGRIVMKR